MASLEGRPEHPGLPIPQRLLAFLTLAMAIAMSVLDGSIVNVALPTMAHDLAVAPAASIWIVNAFLLAVTVSLLPLSALGDTIGYRRVYTPGLALFTLASLACALAPSLPVLTAARAVQGLGAAGIMSVNIALVRFIYPSSKLGQGVGNVAVVVAVSSAGSPTVAAAILSVASWRWLFLINVPIGVVALYLAVRTLPDTPRSKRSLDSMSVALNILTFGLLIAGVDGLGQNQTAGVAAGELIAAAAFGALFVQRQLSQAAPLLPVDLLRRPIFALSLATSILSFAAQSLALVALPFYFEDTLGRSETATGLLMTPWPVATALIAPISGRLADRFAPGLLGGAGLMVMGAGLALVALNVGNADGASLVWRLAICGLGFGFFQSPNNRMIIGSAPPDRSGGAAGLQSAGRLIGQSFGTALMAVAFGRAPEHATSIALWTATGMTLLGACASALRRA
ncbi:MFS transporter [Roseiarcus sp.]|uniref:MFS transporter n=1 Tax=Roseiarcus sp. TaxID=1969460 RepID=UPI003F958800